MACLKFKNDSRVMVKMKKYPCVVFRLGRRTVSSGEHAWLV